MVQMVKERAGTPKIYTVSQFNRLIQKKLEDDFSDVWVEGEISNYRGPASSGHCYFSLKDEVENQELDEPHCSIFYFLSFNH